MADAKKGRRWPRRPTPPDHLEARVEADKPAPDHTTGPDSAAYHFSVMGERAGPDGKRVPVRVRKSIVAASQTLVDKRINRSLPVPRGSKVGGAWDEEAWQLYDETPELHYGVTWAANQLSRVHLMAAELGDDGTPQLIRLDTDTDDEPLDEASRRAAMEVAELAGGPVGQAQLMFRAGQHLTVPGESYIIMRQVRPRPDTATDALDRAETVAQQVAEAAQRRRDLIRPLDVELNDELDDEADTDTDDQQWLVRAYSRNEVGADGTGGDARWWVDEGSGKEHIGENVIVLRVWRPHPNVFQYADSAVRSTLPVLRELRGLTMHVSAQVDSRLAGAGLLALPQEMTFASAGPREDNADDDEEDPFVRELITAMTVPIKDRDSAAAVVPIVIKVPGEYLKEIKHLRFDTPLDEAAVALRSEAIRRLALGLDMPPEIVLGLADLNHWSAWLSDESAIKISTAPLAALLCHVLTTGWLRPMLEESGVPAERSRRLMVWFDTTELESRPDQGQAARDGYDRGEVSGDTMRRETGFGDADKPTEEEFQRWLLVKLLFERPDLAEQLLPALGIQIVITPPTTTPDPSGGGSDPTSGNGGAPGGDRALPERESAPPEAQGQTPEPAGVAG